MDFLGLQRSSRSERRKRMTNKQLSLRPFSFGCGLKIYFRIRESEI